MSEPQKKQTFTVGPIRAEIDNGHRILSWMRAKERNELLRDSMHSAASRWRSVFVPLRFTKYARKAPFLYTYTRAAAWHRAKFPLGLFDQMAMRFDGYNPYSKNAVAVFGSKYEAWLRYQQSLGNFKHSVSGNFSGAKQAYRQWVKRHFRHEFTKWYHSTKGSAAPLVLSGELAAAALTGKVVARSTTRQTRATVTIPRLDRQNPQSVKVLGTVPLWEVQEVAKWFRIALLALVGSPEEVAAKQAAQAMRTSEARRLAEAKRFLASEARKEKKRADQAARQTTAATPRSSGAAAPRRAA